MIWATWTAFPDQPEIVVFSFTIATIVGWVFSWQADLKPFLQPNITALIPASSESSSYSRQMSLKQLKL